MNIQLGYQEAPSSEVDPTRQPFEAFPALPALPACPALQASRFVSRQVSAHHEAVDG